MKKQLVPYDDTLPRVEIRWQFLVSVALLAVVAAGVLAMFIWLAVDWLGETALNRVFNATNEPQSEFAVALEVNSIWLVYRWIHQPDGGWLYITETGHEDDWQMMPVYPPRAEYRRFEFQIWLEVPTDDFLAVESLLYTKPATLSEYHAARAQSYYALYNREREWLAIVTGDDPSLNGLPVRTY